MREFFICLCTSVQLGRGTARRGLSLQWGRALDLSRLCCERQSCQLWRYRVRERVNERQKMETDSHYSLYFGLWDIRNLSSLPCPPPKQDNIEPVKNLLPQTPNIYTYHRGLLKKKRKKNPWQKLDRSKRKSFSVSQISKIFIWSLRFMAGPGNLSWLSTVTDASETISSFLQKSRMAQMHQPS